MQQKKFFIEGINIRKIRDILKKEISPDSEVNNMGDYLLEQISNSGKTFLYVFERYSFLNDSDKAGIFLIDLISENKCIVNIITAGGKQGFLRLDIFGTEKGLLKEIEKRLEEICKDNNWQIK